MTEESSYFLDSIELIAPLSIVRLDETEASSQIPIS